MREIFTGHQLAAGVVTLIALIFLANLLNDLGIVKDRASRIYLHEINDFLVVVPFLVLLLEQRPTTNNDQRQTTTNDQCK